MIGVEFVKDGAPDTEGLKDVLRRCLDKGLVLLECGVDKNIIRLAPPLITTTDEMRQGLDILEDCLAEAGCGS
jgi:4-aminobutyrate aminotransferase-like enzyme